MPTKYIAFGGFVGYSHMLRDSCFFVDVGSKKKKMSQSQNEERNQIW